MSPHAYLYFVLWSDTAWLSSFLSFTSGGGEGALSVKFHDALALSHPYFFLKIFPPFN